MANLQFTGNSIGALQQIPTISRAIQSSSASVLPPRPAETTTGSLQQTHKYKETECSPEDTPQTNGSSSNTPIPATHLLCDFISTANTSLLTPAMRSKLKESLIDYIGITTSASHSADSTGPILKAIKCLFPAHSGTSTVIGQGATYPAQYAGLLNATFAHSLDFDDTHAGGTLHPGVTAFSAALTQAELLDPSSTSADEFLVAVAVGYEIICRLGVELGFEAYSRGMHNTSTAGIFGAIAAISVLKHLPCSTVEHAFGLAGSRAAGSMQYLDNGSHNKRLHPGFAVHDAFMVVSLAEAGVVGATRIIEGKMGFLHAYSPNPDKDLARLTRKLGGEWIFLETSLKPYPACRMTHGVIEMAGLARASIRGDVDGSEVQAMTVRLSTANTSLVGERTTNKLHPLTEVDAQFSVYYQAAHAYLFGADDGLRAYERSRLEDKRVWALSEKIVCVVDDEGQGRGMGSSLHVVFADGSEWSEARPFPLGEAQHPFTRDRVDRKFMGLMDPVVGRERAVMVKDMVDDIEKFGVRRLLELLR